MNVLDAAHQIAHEYTGGAPALAVRMGYKSPKVFEGKVNPNDAAHILGLLADFCGEFGDYMREIDKSMSDNRITPNEVKRLQKELIEMIAAATRLNSRLTQMGGVK